MELQEQLRLAEEREQRTEEAGLQAELLESQKRPANQERAKRVAGQQRADGEMAQRIAEQRRADGEKARAAEQQKRL